MESVNDDEKIVIENCESCEYPVAAKRKQSGLALCDICAPWVETSMSRMEHVPSWMETRYGYLWDSKAQMDAEIEIMHNEFLEMCDSNTGGDWSSGIGTDTPCPGDTEAWVEFLTWVLDGEHPDLISRVRAALNARDSAREPDSPWVSVETIRNRLKMLVDAEEYIAGHTVTVDQMGTWIDDGGHTVLFGHRAHDIHCQRTNVLPELMFDRYHGLDSRPLEELAYLYWREPWMSMIDKLTGARVPKIPAVREAFNRMANGALGNKVADRCRLAILLWSTHLEREFLTCNRDAWKLSFQWVRELVEEFEGSVRAERDGIYVDGMSGNLYRIAPENTNPWGLTGPARIAGDYFEVRKVARVGSDMTKPICIHVAEPKEGNRCDIVMGDIVAGLMMALRNDLISAEAIGPLFRELPRKYQTRERLGDRRGWRRRFLENYPGWNIDRRLEDMLPDEDEEE